MMECMADKIISAIVRYNESHGVKRELDVEKLIRQFVDMEHEIKVMKMHIPFDRNDSDMSRVQYDFARVMVSLIKLNGILFNSDRRMWLEVCDYMDLKTSTYSNGSVEDAMCNDVFHSTKLKLDKEIGEFEQ